MNTIKINLSLFSAIIIVLAICLSCGTLATFDNRIEEGTIEYDVTFPYLYDDAGLLKSLLPDKMQLYFKKEKYVSEMSTVGGMFKNRFISNQKEKSLLHQLKIFKKRVEASYNTEGVNQLLASLPTLSVIETNETDSVAGYLCKKAIGVFDDVSMPEMTILYTEDINIKNPNWCTQFNNINGVLMQYEVEQFGVRMRFTATSVNANEINDELLLPEDAYEEVGHDALQTELELILDTFNL